MVHIGNDWDNILEADFRSDWYAELRRFLAEEYRTHTVYPDMYDIFNALKTTSLGNTRAVILGQDPYHNPGEAHGMCFSVKPGVRVPPSLVNIFKEQSEDLGIYIPNNGYLMPWAKQGVLLLNTVLTVRKNEPFSHRASSCGEAPREPRKNLLPKADISCSKRRILRRFRRITAFSDAGIFPKQTPY